MANSSLDVELLPWQEEVIKDDHRFKIVAGGRRVGKSVLSRFWILHQAVKDPGLYYIVSPTYKQSKSIHWREMNKEIPQDWVAKSNATELSYELRNGSRIELKGSENPDALRGVKLKALVIDEIASIRNWQWLWQEVLRPTLTDYEAPALFISTPKGYDEFHRLFELGQEHGNEKYKSWRFTTYDNPILPKEEIEAAKRDLTEDFFAQEYMADFRKATGIAHKPWNRDIHKIKPFDVPENWGAARGFDYGSAHPTASVRVRIDNDGNWFVDSCYKDNRRTIKEHAEAIKARDYTIGFVPCWGDPSGAQWSREFDSHGLHIQPADKEVGQGKRGWVEHCVERINEMLKPEPGHKVYAPSGEIDDAPKLFVLDKPETSEFIQEIEALKWKETRSGDTLPILDETDDPTGGHYDLMAALRYLAVSYKKPTMERRKAQFPEEDLFNDEGFYV